MGGFDAVFLYVTNDKLKKARNVVRFVQVTRGDTHSWNIVHLYRLLNGLRKQIEIHVVEIFIVVEQTKLSTFRLTGFQINGQGLFMNLEGRNTQRRITYKLLASVVGLYKDLGRNKLIALLKYNLQCT
jgi:hypothetical protein